VVRLSAVMSQWRILLHKFSTPPQHGRRWICTHDAQVYEQPRLASSPATFNVNPS
jgi:hypothetical protein